MRAKVTFALNKDGMKKIKQFFHNDYDMDEKTVENVVKKYRNDRTNTWTLSDIEEILDELFEGFGEKEDDFDEPYEKAFSFELFLQEFMLPCVEYV